MLLLCLFYRLNKSKELNWSFGRKWKNLGDKLFPKSNRVGLCLHLCWHHCFRVSGKGAAFRVPKKNKKSQISRGLNGFLLNIKLIVSSVIRIVKRKKKKRNATFIQANEGKHASNIWENITKGRTLLDMGNGQIINFSEDAWPQREGGWKLQISPHLFPINTRT